ncbi:MAG: hypothetical protein ABIS20_10310 [Thermoanaerobaculia bacterium]
MSRRGIHRIVIALALVAALSGTAAPLAAQPHHAPVAAPLRLGVDSLWAWARLWLGLPAAPGLPGARKAACEGGLSIDPNGLQASPPPATNGDGGLQIDPNG